MADRICHREVFPGVLSQVFCPYGRYAVVLLLEKKCLTHLWLFPSEKLKLHASKSISALGFTAVSKTDGCFVRFHSYKKKQIVTMLPSQCHNAGKQPDCPFVNLCTAGGVRLQGRLRRGSLAPGFLNDSLNDCISNTYQCCDFHPLPERSPS